MTRRFQRRDVIKGAGAAGIAGLAGCTGGDGGDGGDGGGDGGDGGGGTTTTEPTTTTTQSGRTISIGVLMGVTGGLSSLGPPIRDMALLAIQHAREADTPFEIDHQFEDTGTDANQGISGAEALLNAGYPMICGALASPVTLQVAETVAIPNGIPMVSPASTSPQLSEIEDNDFFFRTPPTDAAQGPALAQIAAERLEASTAATLYLNQAYGQGVDAAFTESFESDYDGEVLNRISFAEGQSSYTSQLSSALDGDPDTLLIVAYPDRGGQTILRNFYSDFDQPDLPVLVTDGLQDGSLPGSVGNDLANVTGTAPLATGPGREYTTSEYEDEYGSTPQVSFSWYAYDAAAVLLLANAAAGENDGTAVRDQMRAVANPGGTEVTPQTLGEGLVMAADGEEIQYSGASSAVDFDEQGDMQALTYAYFGFGDGETTTIDQIQIG